MPDKSPLSNYRRIEDALKQGLFESPLLTPTARASLSDMEIGAVQGAEDDWARLWESLSSMFSLGIKSQLAGELTKLEALAQTSIEAISAEIFPVERAVTRLLDCVGIEQMLEERSLVDYRSELIARFQKVGSEAGRLGQTGNDLLNALVEMRNLTTNQILQENLSQIEEQLVAAIRKAQSVQTWFRGRAAENAFSASIEPTWLYVDKNFGTWVRRLKPPGLFGAVGGAAAVALYLVLGAWIPSPLVLYLLLSIVVAMTVWRYFKLRGEQESAVKKTRGELSDIDPLVSRSFWDGAGTPPPWTKASRARGMVSVASNKFPPSVIGAGILMGVSALWAALVFIQAFQGRHWAPAYSVYETRSSAGTSCLIARGIVTWAGPGPLLVLNEDLSRTNQAQAQLSRISPEMVSHLRFFPRSVDPLKPAASVVECIAHESIAHPPVANGPNDGEPRLVTRRSILIPFPGAVHGGCDNRNPTGEGATLEGSNRQMVEALRDALTACHGVRASRVSPPTLDVLGFASSAEFKCEDDVDQHALNLRLAELRRESVLTVLSPQGPRPMSGEWRSEFFRLTHPGERRWRGVHEEMRRHSIFDDREDRMARYVEIQIQDGGDCLRKEPLRAPNESSALETLAGSP